MSHIEALCELIEPPDEESPGYTFEEVQAIRKETVDSLTEQATQQRQQIQNRIRVYVDMEQNQDIPSWMERQDLLTHFNHGIAEPVGNYIEST